MVGLHPRLALGRDARFGTELINDSQNQSGLVALWWMRVPGAPGFRLNLGEAHARRRIGNANQMLAGGTLNLPPGELWFATQRLITV
jgi:hypothetical protein